MKMVGHVVVPTWLLNWVEHDLSCDLLYEKWLDAILAPTRLWSMVKWLITFVYGVSVFIPETS
jgi:hypothetical protein